MSGTVNLHWYNSNGSRSYPIDDSASAVSSDGFHLPSNIILDLNLRYPAVLGNFPFISSVTVTANIVSVTLQCASIRGDVTTFMPLAVIALPAASVAVNRNYAIQSQYPGVAGWIVFGEGIETLFNGRFNGPAAGLLSPRAARPYRPLPITSMAKLYNAIVLTGIINLQAEDPIAITHEQREIEGILRDVAVFSMVQPTVPAGLDISPVNVFETYTGPCGARPESKNCGNAAPIEYINAVQPDCDGNITVEFHGCATLGKVTDNSGAVMDCIIGMIDACVVQSLPTSTGVLANEYPDACESASLSEEEDLAGGFTGGGNPIEVSDNLDGPEATLPMSETFDTESATEFKTITGGFTYVNDDDSYYEHGMPTRSYSTETSKGATQQNISIWGNADYTTLDRVYTFSVKLVPGSPKHNGGLLINWLPTPDFSGRYSYFLVGLDYDTQAVGIWYYDGSNLTLLQKTPPPFLQLNGWYRFVVTVTATGGDGVHIKCVCLGPGLSAQADADVTNFLPDTGKIGLRADRSYARFSYLRVDHA